MQRWGIFLIYAYLRQIYNFKSCPSSLPISPQSLHSVQYSVTLKKGKEIFQSAREFTFCLLQTILIMIIKPFKFIGMAKLQKILQKINVPFYIDSTMFCCSHISDCSCGHFDLRKGFKTWVNGVFGEYDWLAISLTRRPRRNWNFPEN